MAYKDDSILARWKLRRAQPVMAPSESEWRENMRDMGLMLSGIYQDLRGDLQDGLYHFRRGVRAGMRKLWGNRPD